MQLTDMESVQESGNGGVRSGCVLRSRYRSRCQVALRSRSRKVTRRGRRGGVRQRARGRQRHFGIVPRSSKGPSVLWRPSSVVKTFDVRILENNGTISRQILDHKLRHPSGKGLTRQRFRERTFLRTSSNSRLKLRPCSCTGDICPLRSRRFLRSLIVFSSSCTFVCCVSISTRFTLSSSSLRCSRRSFARSTS